MFSLTLLAGGVDASALPSGYGWALVKMMLALVLVCVAAYVALRFGLKKLQARTRGVPSSMRVVERCPLATGRNLWIVEARGRLFLLGETEGGICNLAELDGDRAEAVAADADADADANATGPQPKPSFLDVLRRRPRA